MPDIEVHLGSGPQTRLVGLARAQRIRGKETFVFDYSASWLDAPDRFALEPALPLDRGRFVPRSGLPLFGALADSAPDTWGRRLMQRRERRQAEHERRPVRTLLESDYLLGVSDFTRAGALRLRVPGAPDFSAPLRSGIPPLVELGRLLQVSERILRDEDTEEDLQLIFAPGSSLGGARPKASVTDNQGNLCIAKFPKETDEYSVETWEAVALALAHRAGIEVPEHRLIRAAGKPVLLSRRFDRNGQGRVPYLSALAMSGLADGERGSYPELVDLLTRHGAAARADSIQLYKRVAFNVLVSNVDDHLRNHGFLRKSGEGWTLSPAFDLNPVPVDVRPRVLTTLIDLDDGTCSRELLESTATHFGLAPNPARALLKQVAEVTRTWREAAQSLGARPAEIARMASAFEHEDLQNILRDSRR
jgi:serine/threonine-protein kinase HipA